MNKTDDCIKDFAEILANVFDVDIEVIKLNTSKIVNKLRADNFKKMIADTEKILDEIIDNSDIDVQEKIKSLAIIMLNASMVDADDINTLTQKEAKSYFNAIKVARIKLIDILCSIKNDINRLKNEMAHSKEDEDLTKLSKEELIELLRRK